MLNSAAEFRSLRFHEFEHRGPATALANLRFSEALAQAFGFALWRVRGSHHILTYAELPELLNMQDVGGEAKSYQVRQLLRLVERYNLKLENGT